MNWKDKFSNYATSVGFQISISKAQIKCLKTIRNSEVKITRGAKYTFEQYQRQGHTLTLISLESKGLIEQVAGMYQLTPVGITLMSLLDMCKTESKESNES